MLNKTIRSRDKQDHSNRHQAVKPFCMYSGTPEPIDYEDADSIQTVKNDRPQYCDFRDLKKRLVQERHYFVEFGRVLQTGRRINVHRQVYRQPNARNSMQYPGEHARLDSVTQIASGLSLFVR